ncbi:LamG domain-containing protein, partial [bacterium]|nr:LamG domain-containing protein [bacterium]
GKETFTGILDDVAMWNRALSPEEITTVFTSGPLAVERPAKELAVTSFDLSEITGEFTLTWNSNIGEVYAVKYSTDLINWDADLDDGILADEGETTSRTFKLTDLDNPKALYFRIEKQEEQLR